MKAKEKAKNCFIKNDFIGCEDPELKYKKQKHSCNHENIITLNGGNGIQKCTDCGSII